jgi:hypothetical protein
MPIITVDKILEAVQALTAEEQRELRVKLDQGMAQQDESAKMQAFHQALRASGLVTRIKTPSAGASRPRRLIVVKGKPLSETIMEERR